MTSRGWDNFGSSLLRTRDRISGVSDTMRYSADLCSVLLDGVVTNSYELVNEMACTNLGSAIIKLYDKYGKNFPNYLRGNFCGFLVDESKKTTIIFTNHFGARPIFYSQDREGVLLISTDFASLSRLLAEWGCTNTLDETAAYYLLSFGYMLDRRTLIAGAFKLNPGSVLVVQSGSFDMHRYYKYDNESREMSERQAVDGFYERFMQAVARGFKKDVEFGRRHISLLSGGLDSRLVIFAAHSLGFRDLLTLSFGQSGCYDVEIAKAISVDLRLDHLFLPLDGGDYLRDIATPLYCNGGLIIYSGAAHAVRAYSRMDWGALGLLHNGNLADISHGDYVDDIKHTPPSAKFWAYSTRLLYKIAENIEAEYKKYPNQESFAVHTRGINGIMNGSYSALPFCETDEPFMDVDLVDFCSKFPPVLKKGEKAFLMMIEKYFPKSTMYPWQRWGLRPTMRNYRLTSGFAYKVFKRLRLEYLAISHKKKPPRFDMNPMGHWIRTNKDLASALLTRYQILRRASECSEHLLRDCDAMASGDSPIELMQALTFLEAEREFVLKQDRVVNK